LTSFEQELTEITEILLSLLTPVQSYQKIEAKTL
jgi:hypothetical protein